MRIFKFEGTLMADEGWGVVEIYERMVDLLDEPEFVDVRFEVHEIITPEAIRSARDVLKTVAAMTATDHDKQILEVAAGILAGAGERKK